MQQLTLEQQRDLFRRQLRGYELIERERRSRLATLDYQSNLPLLESLLSVAYRHRQPRLSSGLVHWQKLMARLEERRERDLSGGA